MKITKPFTIREAVPDDTDQLLALLTTNRAEPGIFLISETDEAMYTPEEEREFIRKTAAAANSVYLVAVSAETGDIVGICVCSGGERRAQRHGTRLGISILKEWRDQGVGTALMTSVIEWAKASGVVKRIELNCYVENERAVHVYQKVGFQIEGTLRKSVFKYGRYWDEYVMSYLIE